MEQLVAKFNALRMQQKFYVFFGGGILALMILFMLSIAIFPPLSFLVIAGGLFGFVHYARKVFKCPHCDAVIMVGGGPYLRMPGSTCASCSKEY
jgi:hypothetical protein